MKRKQKKIIPLRKVGYVILIIIKFGELLLWISLNFRVQSKHWDPNTEKLVEKTRLRLVFSTNFSVFGHLLLQPTSLMISTHLADIGHLMHLKLCLVFSTNFSVFGHLMKHSSLCLIYHNKHWKLITSISKQNWMRRVRWSLFGRFDIVACLYWKRNFYIKLPTNRQGSWNTR